MTVLILRRDRLFRSEDWRGATMALSIATAIFQIGDFQEQF